MRKKDKIYTKTFSFRITETERNVIEFQAVKMNLTPSEYIRNLINKKEFISN